MPESPISSLFICHWSLNDPLCQSQALAYMRPLAAAGHRYALVTFEQPPHVMNAAEVDLARGELRRQGIYWFPLAYHNRLALASKAYDWLRGIALGLRVNRRHRPAIIHTRGTTSAGIAIVLQALTGMKFLYDADSSLADEYADTGYWTRDSAAFRVTAACERAARRRAKAVVVLSDRMRRRFVDEHRVAVPVEVIPCCVDTDRVTFDPDLRRARRADLGVSDGETLFVYVGKAGWRYQVDPMFAFLAAARTALGPTKVLVLSGNPPDEFRDAARRHGFGEADLHVRRSSPADVPGWLSAADAGLAFIRSLPCEEGSAPVKVAEYLSTGLPVVITPDIGDYSSLIDAERLGVVVRGSQPPDLAAAAGELRQLFDEGVRLRERCRSAAIARLSIDRVGAPRYAAVYRQLGCDHGIPGAASAACAGLSTGAAH